MMLESHHSVPVVIAEFGISSGRGVETEEQNTLVSSSACDFVQGWYYSKALPLEECESFIDKYENQ